MTTLIYIYIAVLGFCLAYRYFIIRTIHVVIFGQPPKRSEVWNTLLFAFVLLLLIVILRAFAFDVYRIPTKSMAPGYPPGTLVFSNKMAYGIKAPLTNTTLFGASAPNRGDEVLVKNPRNPETVFFKRMIGLPGDTVEYKNKQLFINGSAITQKNLDTNLYEECLEECYRIQLDPDKAPINGSWSLGDDQYLVMGDNRDHSGDSREWGPILPIHLLGKIQSDPVYD